MSKAEVHVWPLQGAALVETGLQRRECHSCHLAMNLSKFSRTWFLIWKMKGPPYLPHRMLMRFKMKHVYKHALSTRKHCEKVTDMSFCLQDADSPGTVSGQSWEKA